MAPWSRRARWLTAFAIGLASASAALYWVFIRDEPAPPDEDLRGFRRLVSSEDNGFYVLQTMKPIQSPLESALATAGGAVEGYVSVHVSPPTELELRDWLESNAGAFETLDACLALPDFQFPERESLSEPMDSPQSWRSLAFALETRARMRSEEGKTREALEDAMRLVQLGYRIESGQGPLFVYEHGAVVRQRGAKAVIETLRRNRSDLPEPKRCIAELGRHERTVAGLKDALREEYVTFAACCHDMTEWERMSVISGSWPERALFALLFKRNATLRMYAEDLRRIIDAANAVTSPGENLDLHSAPPGGAGIQRLVVNFPGKLMLTLVPPMQIGSHYERQTAFIVRAAEVFLAVRAHQATHERLPPVLSDLIPEYLPAVPLDPFDGQPLRYSAAKRILYSVGLDLQDSGGSGEEAWAEALDDESEPTLRLEP